jgi:hypothetical protein
MIVAGVICRPSAPLSFLRELLAKQGKTAALAIAVFLVGISAFSTYKHQLPNWVPFFADHALARWDEAIHAGQPWRYAHLVAPDEAADFLLVLYGPLWFLQFIGGFLIAAFIPDRAVRLRYITAFAMVLLILGTVGRMLGSSAGPIFYDRLFGGTEFADMMAALAATRGGAKMIMASDYLYQMYSSGAVGFGAGISAMPSIHVAAAVLNALFLASFNRWLGLVGWVYASAIMFGSVYFGWHYALDGYVSIVAVLLIWRFAKVLAR